MGRLVRLAGALALLALAGCAHTGELEIQDDGEWDVPTLETANTDAT
jgi:hypothetical protein